MRANICPAHSFAMPCEECFKQGVIDLASYNKLERNAQARHLVAAGLLDITRKLKRVLERFVSEGEVHCDYNPHGYCQAHMMHKKPCPWEEGRELLVVLEDKRD